MTNHWVVISGILFLNFFIGLWLAWHSYKKRAQGGQVYFALLMLAASYFSLTYGLEIITTDISLKIFWAKIENIGIVSMPVLWFMFAFVYTQQARWFSRKIIILFFVIPLITLILLASPFSSLHYETLADESVMGPVLIKGGVWYWVQMAQNYFFLILGAFVILRAVVRYSGIYRGQSAILLLGILIPCLMNLYYLFGKNIFPQDYASVDFTPVAFMFTGVLYSLSVFRLKFLNLAPIAREIIFENIPEMVLVLDAEERVVDINSVGQNWLNVSHTEATGRPVSELLKDLSDLFAKYGNINKLR